MNKETIVEADPVKKYGNVVGEMLRIQDVVGFFKHDINPSYVDSKIESIITREKRGLHQVPMGWIVGIGALMLFAAIAYMIIGGQMTSGSDHAALIACLSSKAGVNITTVQTPSQPTGIVGVVANTGAGIGIK